MKESEITKWTSFSNNQFLWIQRMTGLVSDIVVSVPNLFIDEQLTKLRMTHFLRE